MSKRPSTNSRSVLSHTHSISPHPDSSSVASPPVDGQSGRSNGHSSNSSHSASLTTTIANYDLEKQLSRENRPVNGKVGSPHPKVPPTLAHDNQNAIGQDNDLSDPPDHLRTGPSNLDQYADFWNVYNKEADREDEELIKGFAGDLDTLLIFAGLFSAINTAFIVESFKDLRPDQSELTNKLLRNMMQTIHKPSSFTEADLLLKYTGPPARAIVVNFFFFASLCCSLFTAFGAVIGKQWLNHYGTESQLRSPCARGIERQRKYMGLETWKFKAVVETLPVLLQLSLFYFFIGLIVFMWPLNIAIATLILLFTVVTLLFYVITIFIGIRYPNSPFQTRLTNVLKECFIPEKSAPVEDQNEKMDILQARCVAWLQQRTTCAKTIGIISRAVTLLTEDGKRAIDLERPGSMLGYILRSSMHNGQVYLGISAEGLQTSLIMLKDVISQWDKRSDLVHKEDSENAILLRTLNRELWNLLPRIGTIDEVKSSTALAILEKLGPCGQRDSLNSRAKYLIQSLGKQLTRQDQLVRLGLLHDVLWSESLLRSVVTTCKTKKHISEVLATTMWGLDGKPDLDHRRVELRLSWFLADPSGMYSHIQDRDFGRYLSLWCEVVNQLHPPTSFKFDFVYPVTVIRLLVQDQEKWAKELDKHGHLKHIEAIMPDDLTGSDPQLLAFILIAHIAGTDGDPNAPASYYSQARVDRVVQQLRAIHPHGTRFDFGSLQPHHANSINQSLQGYIQTAYQYQRIQDNVLNEVSQLAKTLMDHIRSEAL